MVDQLNEFLAKHFPDRMTPNCDGTLLAIQIISELKGIEPEKHKFIFTANVWFNVGLGNQNKILPDIVAETPEIAQKMAEKIAEQTVPKWLEVKIRPIGKVK